MEQTNDQVFWIWFQLLFGYGSQRAEAMFQICTHPKEIYEAVVQRNRAITDLLTDQEISISEHALGQAELIRRRTLKKGCDIVTPDHPAYPKHLREIWSKPAVLYVKGDLSCMQNHLCIAMVGTRKHSSYGAHAGEMLAAGLGAQDVIVISGLAKGIDTICHKAALDAGGKSVGILGCGIDVDYPKGSAALKRAMCEHGAVVTEYPLGTQPRPEHFPLRNRLLSGMAEGVVVVEADENSGSLITAHHAMHQGREVFAVPGSIFSSHSRGALALIRDGVKPVACVEDILEEFCRLTAGETLDRKETAFPATETTEPDLAEKQNMEEIRSKITLSSEAGMIYEIFGNTLLDLQEIEQKVNMNTAMLHTALTELEIYGLIRGYPGRKFGPGSLQS